MNSETPKNLAKAPSIEKRQSERKASIFAAALILLLGLGATGVLTEAESQHLDRRNQQHFDRLVERVTMEVKRRVTVYRYGLMGTRSVFAASSYVDRDEFKQLVGARELGKEFPGATGVGFIERVPNNQEAIDAFVKKVRDEGATDFEIKLPPGAAPLEGSVDDGRYIIKYIEPYDENRNARGLDIGAHPVRRAAAEEAMMKGDGCLTGIIYLVQAEDQVAGFLYLLPFYKPGMPTQTPEQRREALVGWVYMPLLGPKVFDKIVDYTDREVDVEVFDGEDLEHAKLIYDADGHLSDIEHAHYTRDDYTGRMFHIVVPIEIGGRTWTLSLSTTPEFAVASRTELYYTAICGALLSVLLSGMVYLQGASTRRAWAIAEGMTADLREYAELAENATKTKSEFLANMSHEIRTPMTAILGFTDLLRTQIDEENRELLMHTETIKRNGEHLLSLINDILDISKIEAGKLDVESITVRPDAVVGEVLSLMRVKADEKHLPLGATMLTAIPGTIKSDPVRLRQVLVNLVGNAIKFTQTGGVKIEVRYDDKMRHLKFAVTDTGRGMTQEQVTRLFKAFEQADTTTTRQYGGTGLGLHISQRLAGMLSGTITCNSEFGKGSTFTLSIDTGEVDPADMIGPGPITVVIDTKKARSAIAGVQNAVDEVFGNKPPLTGLKILLAEDGKDNQRLINHHLTKAGASVKIVDNGRLAVEELCVGRNITGPLHKQPPFDLLITDMQMPEMDGYTEVRLLRQLGSTLPIVALTAHAMTEDITKCMDAGCNFYASKPIDRQKLIDVCLEAAGRKTVNA